MFSLRCAIVALAGACGPAGNGDSPDAADDARPEIESPHPRAAYLTSLTFVGFEATPSLVHLRFENLADRNRLALSYHGWVAGRDDWSSLIAVEDTIPVARAAWRVLPVGGLRLRVGPAARIDGLRLPLDGQPLRLESLDAISWWSSSTGQRESLRSAELLFGPGGEAGLLLQRRLARPLDSERPPSPSQAFVLTDTLGNGLVVLRSRALPDAPALAWVWIDGERLEWSDAVLISLASGEASPGRWSLEVSGENVVAELEAFLPVRRDSSASGSGYVLYPVRATLSAGDVRRTLSGVGIEDDGP